MRPAPQPSPGWPKRRSDSFCPLNTPKDAKGVEVGIPRLCFNLLLHLQQKVFRLVSFGVFSGHTVLRFESESTACALPQFCHGAPHTVTQRRRLLSGFGSLLFSLTPLSAGPFPGGWVVLL
jgi:hypothetical protein